MLLFWNRFPWSCVIPHSLAYVTLLFSISTFLFNLWVHVFGRMRASWKHLGSVLIRFGNCRIRESRIARILSRQRRYKNLVNHHKQCREAATLTRWWPECRRVDVGMSVSERSFGPWGKWCIWGSSRSWRVPLFLRPMIVSVGAACCWKCATACESARAASCFTKVGGRAGEYGLSMRHRLCFAGGKRESIARVLPTRRLSVLDKPIWNYTCLQIAISYMFLRISWKMCFKLVFSWKTFRKTCVFLMFSWKTSKKREEK